MHKELGFSSKNSTPCRRRDNRSRVETAQICEAQKPPQPRKIRHCSLHPRALFPFPPLDSMTALCLLLGPPRPLPGPGMAPGLAPPTSRAAGLAQAYTLTSCPRQQKAPADDSCASLLGILRQLHDGRSRDCDSCPGSDHLVHAVQVRDDVQPHLRALRRGQEAVPEKVHCTQSPGQGSDLHYGKVALGFLVAQQ